MANEDYQIIALANLQLEKHLNEMPLTLEGAQRVKWDIEESEYHYIAKGTLHIPIEIYFGKPEGDEDPEVRRVVVSGKRRYDARYEEVDKTQDGKSRSERIAALDETAARAESFSRFRKNMGGH